MSERVLIVSVGGVDVGHLWADRFHSHFSLHDAYLNAADRPVLGQYFEDRLRKKPRRVPGLHAWFENALPEKSGALRRRIARGLGVDIDDSVALLEALGDDLPGAVRVRPDPSMPTLDAILDEPGADAVLQSRFSLGGVQLKFSMSGEPERLALGVRGEDGVAWILKLGTTAYPELAENEHAMMSWCRMAGFDVPETHVVPTSSLPDLGAIPEVPTGFLVRRYDRTEQGRVHQEDFAQVLNVPPAQKYASTDAAGVLCIARQVLGEAGVEEGLRRWVAVVAMGNCDAHLKNWSLLYPNRVRATWTPMYDQVATIAYPQLAKELALRIGTARHLHQVERQHLRWAAERAGLGAPRCDALIDETLRALGRTFGDVDMPGFLADELEQHWERVPLLREHKLG